MPEAPNPDKIQDRFIGPLDLYLNAGIKPSDFLTCVLCNDLQGAICCADAYSQDNLKHIVMYLQSYFPPTVWGSVEKYHAHIRLMDRKSEFPKHRGYPPEDLDDPFYKIGGTD